MAETMNEIMHPKSKSDKELYFPNAPANWREQDAIKLAKEEELELGDDHWGALRALQEYFSRHEYSKINVRELHDALDERFHSKGGIKYLYLLFPRGPVAQGCRIAGLKPPPGTMDKGFGSVG